MSNDPYARVMTRSTPQREQILGRTDQIENSAGGFVFGVDDWQRALRFLILGSAGGTYYIGESDLTRENAAVIIKLSNSDGEKLVDLIVDVSVNGRAPKQNPTLFALAICCASQHAATRKAALAAIPKVCRTGTMLFIFSRYVEQFRGWGRGLRSAVGSWYSEKEPEKLAYQAIKYRQREGWTHGDLLRLSHPGAPDLAHAGIYDWMLGKPTGFVPELIVAYETAQVVSTKELPSLISAYGLPWEALPDSALNDPAVWEALLPNLGLTATIRQLGRLSRIGLVAPMSAGTKAVVAKLSDSDELVKSRVHPMNILTALRTYGSGQGFRGGSTWNAVPQVIDALDGAFYASFGNVVPANKRTLIGLDVSGSMGFQTIQNSPLTPRDAAAAMAMVTVRTEDEYAVMAFSNQFINLPLSPSQRLDDVIRQTSGLPFTATDCALPMLYATHHKIAVDTFVVLTDSETWAGHIQPTQALQQYREFSGIDAKLVVVGMVSNGFTIADPTDAGQLDVVGFDTGTPDLISGFSRGDF